MSYYKLITSNMKDFSKIYKIAQDFGTAETEIVSFYFDLISI